MGAMYKVLPAVAIAALVAIVPAPPAAASGTQATPAPGRTPPPTIYHVITRPLCAELHKHIAPAIGMMLQNDQQIKKGPGLFSEYNKAALYGADNSASLNNGPSGGGSSMNNTVGGPMTASQNMALLGMENLVSPIANNIIAIQKMLDSPALTQGTGSPEDDKKLAEIRDKLLKALAAQNASLDIINGFVSTQQMGDLQHAGEGYIGAIDQSEQKGPHATTTPTPNPLIQGPTVGLPNDPYVIEPATIPGLTLGYNPVTRLLDALHWTIDQTSERENTAASAVMESKALCDAPAPTPAPTAKPSH